MHLVDSMALAPLPPEKADQAPRSRLLLEGRETPAVVPGVILEGAADTGAGWLLFTTDDVPHEESLNICFLDRQLRQVDRVTLAWPYGTGVFRHLRVLSPRSLQFEFFGDRPWILELLDGAAWRLPLLGEPRGVWRAFGFRRYFRIRLT